MPRKKKTEATGSVAMIAADPLPGEAAGLSVPGCGTVEPGAAFTVSDSETMSAEELAVHLEARELARRDDGPANQ